MITGNVSWGYTLIYSIIYLSLLIIKNGSFFPIKHFFTDLRLLQFISIITSSFPLGSICSASIMILPLLYYVLGHLRSRISYWRGAVITLAKANSTEPMSPCFIFSWWFRSSWISKMSILKSCLFSKKKLTSKLFPKSGLGLWWRYSVSPNVQNIPVSSFQ